MSVEGLLGRINQQEGTTFKLVGRFAGGEQGAHAIVDGRETRFVLKSHQGTGYLLPFQRARVATEHLAAQGYPVPQYRYVGEVDGAAYAIQSRLPGEPMKNVDASFLSRLLQLNDLQAGPAPLPRNEWLGMILYSVLLGFPEYCVIESLRRYSPAASELLDRLQAIVKSLADIDCASNDVVHFDFTQANILTHDGEISGVIDWDGVVAGDRAFDLATLLFYANDQPLLRQALWRQGIERSSREAMRLYLAHLIVRQVDWSIRHHSRFVVEYWLSAARRFLHEMN